MVQSARPRPAQPLSDGGPKNYLAAIQEEELRRPEDIMRENEALRDRLSRLNEASLRINWNLDLEAVSHEYRMLAALPASAGRD